MLNKLFGLVLAIGIVVVGVKACDHDFSKTENLATHVTVQRAIVIDDAPLTPGDTLAVVELRIEPCPPPTIKQVSIKQRAYFVKRFTPPIKRTVAVKKHYSKKTFSKTKPTVNTAKAKRTVAVKKHYSKTKHVYKFVVSHHHKSKVSPPFKAKPKPHHHHGGHHHHSGGHHHSSPTHGPQTHGPETHHSGCPG